MHRKTKTSKKTPTKKLGENHPTMEPAKERFKVGFVANRRAGRPRNDGKPPRVRKAALPLAVRRGLLEMLQAKKTYAEIQLRYKRYKPTKSQIDGIKYERVKTVKEPRKDSFAAPPDADSPVLSSADVSDLLREQLLVGLNRLRVQTGVAADERISICERAARVDRHIKASQLERHLKNPDARIIAALVRRYEPEATDERVVTVYREELAKVQQEIKGE
jgi:hypothetical protein